MNRFTGQTAIITGGCSGLGLSIARRLVAEGAFVGIVDLDEAAGASVKREFGDRCVFDTVDVTDEDQVRECIGKLERLRKGIDIVVNCAGITGHTNVKSHEVELDDFERVFSVNVGGSFLVSKHAVPGMLQRNYGRVLHIASIAGKEGNAGMLAYSASKAAVIGMTKTQGKDYAETGVTVNALAPAVIETPMVAALPREQVDYMTSKIPMKRCGTLEEVAATAAFIVSRESSFTTGFTFDLTGGRAVY